MKVLFLDIDGVLNSRAYDRTRDYTKDTNIDPSRLPLVKKIVDRTGAAIVLSSTWREDWEKDPSRCKKGGKYIDRIFNEHGLHIYDKTPDLGLTALRKDEVAAWLSETDEPIESFAILDDYPFGWGELSDRFVKTDPRNGLGLEQEHVERIVALLNEN